MLPEAYSNPDKCILCPRRCGVNRNPSESEPHYGYCGQSSTVTLARAALHMWEEPCISGTKGSGAVFFCGCNLRCVFCQNYTLANSKIGKPVSVKRLSDIFLELQEKQAHNINLVTPGHFIPQLVYAIETAKNHGLTIPICYNTGSYEYASSLRMLDGLVDIYIPDLKYMDSALSLRLSNAPDYFDIASSAIEEMYRQTGPNVFSDAGLMTKGTLIRHLILPGHTDDSRDILKYIYDTYGNNVYVSIMNQYTPMDKVTSLLPDMPELHNTLSPRVYERLVNYCIKLGYTNAYIQEGDTCSDSFIPVWDYSGV